jgi:glycine/D-amino acid oxidase-like deaminating enzyme
MAAQPTATAKGMIVLARGQVLATAPMRRIFPCAMSADHGLQYWQQLPDVRIVLGGGRMAVADHEVGYTDTHLRSEVQAVLDRHLGSLFVGLEQLDIEHRWAGIMGFSSDALPFYRCCSQQRWTIRRRWFYWTWHAIRVARRAGIS